MMVYCRGLKYCQHYGLILLCVNDGLLLWPELLPILWYHTSNTAKKSSTSNVSENDAGNFSLSLSLYIYIYVAL